MGMDKTGIQAYQRKLVSKLRAQNPKAFEGLKDVNYDWYRLKNAAKNSSEYDLYIYDEIMPQWLADLFGSGVGAEGLIAELEGIDAETINVRINSPGGAVFEAIAIYNALVTHDATINVYVDALAASAASIIAMSGDTITMMVGSQMMIHDAMGVGMGNATDMRDYAKFLDGQSDNLASIYAARNGAEIKDMRALMLAETWLNAPEAVELGFADGVYKKPAPSDADPEKAPEEEDPKEEDPEEQDPEEDDPEKEKETDNEESEEDVTGLMNRKHSLVNRGFKYAGRNRAPAPTPENIEALSSVLLNFLGGK